MNLSAFRRFLGMAGQRSTAQINTAIATVGAATLTGASVAGGLITRTGSTAAYTDTTPTAAALFAAMGMPATTGQSWELEIKNNTSFIETISGGTGCTVSVITAIPPFATARYLVTYSAAGAYTMVGISIAPVLTNFSEVVAAANVIAASENGATFYLALAGGFQSTLPAPAVGLQFDFIVSVAPTTAYTIIAPASATILYGSAQSAQGGACGIGTGEATFSFVANQAAIGDCVFFKSDGTNWYCRAFCNLDAGITIA